jgi:hypothetical protein
MIDFAWQILPMFYMLHVSPLWEKIGLFGGEQYGCFPAVQILAKHLNYFIIT